MKIYIQLLLFAFLASKLFAQSNTFPTSGNVGIGTASPTATLHVSSNNQASGDFAVYFNKPRQAANAAFTYTFDNVGGVLENNRDGFWRGLHLAAPYISVNGTNTFPRLGFYAEYNSLTDPTVAKFVINAANSPNVPHDIQFKSNDNELMYLKANGNVGIGTTSPGSKLDVSGEIRQNGRSTYLFGANSNQNQALIFSGWGIAHGGIYWRGETRTFTLTTGDNADNPKNYGNANLVVDGKIGIGTDKINDVDYKLFVETGIRTRKVKVDQAVWSDYVFKSTYRLRPLSEVEQYIRQHGHLPEVPSAEEVNRNGLNLGDNQATLLKKIEELTLYIIELNKRVHELEKQVKEK